MAGFGGIKKVKCAAAKPVFFCLSKKRIYSAAYSNMFFRLLAIFHISHFLVSFKQCSLYTAL